MPRSFPIALVIALLSWVPSAAQQDQRRPHQAPRGPSILEAEPVPEIARGSSFIDVVFVLDSTGSMSGLIEGAKQKIWSIANAIATAEPRPQIRMGLVSYRDREDAYITRISKLTDDLDYFYSDLMQVEAGGGGDTPESVNQALHEAVTRITWSDDRSTLRLLYLVGDAPPHMDYDEVQYPESARLAAERDIFINTIQCGKMGGTREVWREISSLARGQYFAIDQSGGVRSIESPFDGELARLSRESDGTFLPYGSESEIVAQKEKQRVAREIDEAASKSALAERAVFKNSSAGKASFGGGKEFLQDVESGDVDLGTLEEAELPDALQAVPEAEREQWIADQIARRRGLREEIVWLNDKRMKWLAANNPDGDDGFDHKVLEALRRQASTKGIRYTSE
jgi:Mg-chelatase subunit ChlD